MVVFASTLLRLLLFQVPKGLRFLTTLWDQEFQDDIRCALEEQRHGLHQKL